MISAERIDELEVIDSASAIKGSLLMPHKGATSYSPGLPGFAGYPGTA